MRPELTDFLIRACGMAIVVVGFRGYARIHPYTLITEQEVQDMGWEEYHQYKAEFAHFRRTFVACMVAIVALTYVSLKFQS